MAYDKVVDSTQLETALKAMADAIREKTGDTALIEWLANKGFAEEIAGIESGGGEFNIVTYTPAEDITKPTIMHGLGKVPTSVIACVKQSIGDDSLILDSPVFGCGSQNPNNGLENFYYLKDSTSKILVKGCSITYSIISSVSGKITGLAFANATAESITLHFGGETLPAGVTYYILLK